MSEHPLRIFISQRILTRYREDAFYELAQDKDFEILVAFGDRNKKNMQNTLRLKQRQDSRIYD